MPRPRRTRAAAAKQVEALRHEQDTRTNIPTAEYQSLVREEQEAPLRTACQRRTRDGDPQQCAVWSNGYKMLHAAMAIGFCR